MISNNVFTIEDILIPKIFRIWISSPKLSIEIVTGIQKFMYSIFRYCNVSWIDFSDKDLRKESGERGSPSDSETLNGPLSIFWRSIFGFGPSVVDRPLSPRPKKQLTDHNLIKMCALAFMWITAIPILDKTSIISILALIKLCNMPFIPYLAWLRLLFSDFNKTRISTGKIWEVSKLLWFPVLNNLFLIEI